MSDTTPDRKHQGSPRGFGQLGIAEQERAIAMLKAGANFSQAAILFGVTRNTIAGIWQRHGEPATPYPSTLWTRCAALEARLAAVIAENDGVGRIPGSNEAPRRLSRSR